MVGIAPLAWLTPEIMVTSAVGLGAAVAAVIATLFFTRTRPQPAPPPPPAPQKDPEYDPFMQGSASEQRKAYRRGGNPVQVLIRRPESALEPVRGLVLNRSTGGLCLSVEGMVAEGTILEVRPGNAPPITPWVEVEVRTCRRTQDGWEVGCQFVRTPPWALLLMFG
jgi:hypothetical protein